MNVVFTTTLACTKRYFSSHNISYAPDKAAHVVNGTSTYRNRWRYPDNDHEASGLKGPSWVLDAGVVV